MIVKNKYIGSEIVSKKIATMSDKETANALIQKANQAVTDYKIEQRDLFHHMQMWHTQHPKPTENAQAKSNWHQQWMAEHDNYINTHFSIDGKMFETEDLSEDEGFLPFWTVEEVDFIIT